MSKLLNAPIREEENVERASLRSRALVQLFTRHRAAKPSNLADSRGRHASVFADSNIMLGRNAAYRRRGIGKTTSYIVDNIRTTYAFRYAPVRTTLGLGKVLRRSPESRSETRCLPVRTRYWSLAYKVYYETGSRNFGLIHNL